MEIVGVVGLAGVVEELVPDEHRGAQCATGVARGGLYPDIIEDALAEDLAVADAVERHAPAMTRWRIPVSLRTWRAVRSMISSVTAWMDAAMSISRWGDPRFGFADRAVEELFHLRIGHGQALAIIEVGHVHPEGAVLFQIKQVVDDEVFVFWLSVGGEAHEFVLAGVDPEPREVGEGRVEQAQGVRKT